MKRTFLPLFWLSALWLLAPIFAFAQNNNDDVPSGTLQLIRTTPIGTSSASANRNNAPNSVTAVSPTALYSNVTTSVAGTNYTLNGGAAGTPIITRLIADQINLVGTAPFSGKNFTFSMANLNTSAFSVRPRIRFYQDNGGVPGASISGFSFNPISIPANSYNYFNAVASFTLPNNAIWVGMTFDNLGGTATTAAQVNNFGIVLFNPVDVGTSADGLFLTTAAGSFLSSNPAGAAFSFGGTPVANMFFEINGCDATPLIFTTCPTNQAATADNTCTAIANYTATAANTPNAPTYTYAFTGATTRTGTGTGSGQAFNIGTTTVTITATNGCSATTTCIFDVVVTAPSIVAGAYGPVCANAAPIALTATPMGGVWSGTGIVGNTFDPAGLSGSYDITYTACGNAATVTVVVATPVAAVGASIVETPIIYAQNFDDITTLAAEGWTITNNSSPLGTTNWFQGDAPTFDAFNGATDSSYIAANYQNTTGANTISNWLLAPTATFHNGDVVSFYTRTVDTHTFADRLEVRLSTAGASSNVGTTNASVGDFTNLLLTINPTLIPTNYPSVWTQYTATISGLAGATTGRIAFRYFVTDGGLGGTNSDYIGVDAYAHTTTTAALSCNGSNRTFTATATNGGAAPTFDFRVNGTSVQSSTSNTFSTTTLNDADALTVVITNNSGACFSNNPATSAPLSISEVIVSATLSGGGTVCAGATLPTITATFTGTPPFAFTYTDGSTSVTETNITTNTFNFQGTATGTYSITAMNDATCTATDLGATVNVLINPLLTATTSGGGTACAGATMPNVNFTFTGTPPYSFTYTDGTNSFLFSNYVSNTYTLTGTATGTYSITALSDAACPSASLGGSVVVAVNAIPNITAITATPSNLCNTSTSQLSTDNLNTGYTMDGNSGVAFIDISTTGTSVGTVGDDTEHNITIPSFIYNNIAYTNARVGNNGAMVFGVTTGDISYNNLALPATNLGSTSTIGLAPWWDDLTPLSASAANTIHTQTIGNLFIIQWTNEDHYAAAGAGTVTFQVQLNTATGHIHFVYNDVIFGASAAQNSGGSATIGINFSSTSALQYSFNTPSLVNGQSITFSPIITHTYSWSPTSTLNNATIFNPIASGITATTDYTVTVTNLATGCTNTAMTTVTFNPPLTAVTSGGGTVCAGATQPDVTFTFTGTPPYDFTYTNGTTSVNITAYPTNTYTLTAAAAGIYRITALSGGGCTSISLGGTAPVIVNPFPVTTPYSLCVGATVVGGLSSTLSSLPLIPNFTGATTLASPTYTRPQNFIQGATCVNSITGSAVYYTTHSFVAPNTGTYTFTTCGTTPSWDSFLALYLSPFNPAGACAGNTSIAANDDTCGLLSSITVNLTAGTFYVLVVTGFDSNSIGAYTVTTTNPPTTATPTVEWYTATTGGSAIATGSPFNPVGAAGSGITDTNTPTATTFYAQFPNSTCRTPTVFTVNNPPIATITAAAPQCNSTTITATSVSTITNYSWSNAATTPAIAATTTNTYTVTITDSNTCTGTISLLVTPVDCNNIYTGAATCNSITIPNVQGNAWFDIVSTTGIVASINPNGMNLGDLTISISNLAAPPTYGNNTFLPRTMDIQCAAYPTGVLPSAYSIKLYYYDSEFEAYKTAINNTTATLSDLGVAWSSGGSGCTVAGYGGTSNGLVDKAMVGETDYGQTLPLGGLNGFYLNFDLDHFTIFAPTVNTPAPLPVKLLSFAGKAINKTNKLYWATATEQNADVFIVESSTNGVDFKNIGSVTALNNQNGGTYTFTDTEPTAFTYYRLKMIDKDGSFEYSNVISLYQKTNNFEVQSVYPNPTASNINVSFTSENSTTVDFTLYDAVGKQVTSIVKTSQIGFNLQSISMDDLPSGVYHLSITNYGGRRTIHKIVKM